MLCFEDFVVGETTRFGSIAVSEADIVAYASRFDAQDFHTDPVAAKASFAGRLIASGWHSCALLMRLIAEGFLLDATALGAPGVEEVKWLRPVLPGDVLSARRTVLESKASRSRPDLGLVRFSFELLNQRDEPVLQQTNWIMFGRRSTVASPLAGDWLAHSAAYVAPAEQSPLEPPTQPVRPAGFFEDLQEGDVFELGSFVFTPAEIVAFARSFDPQPFHLDAAAAEASPIFGRLAASGWHTAAIWMATMVSHRKRQEAAFRAGHAGSPPRLGPSPGFTNLRWSRPVLAGDRLTFHSRITGKRESASRPQWGLFFHRNTGVNQTGEEVFSFDGCAFVERKTG